MLRDKFYYFEKNKHCVTSWFDTNCLYWRTNKIEKKNQYLDFLKIQLKECVPVVQEIIIAYEPIWSIGSGLVPSFEDILEVKDFVKKFL